jgi:hypothetical protein
MGVRPAMGTVGDAYDNAMAELLCLARMRVARPAQLPKQDRSVPGTVHLHRGLVQPALAALGIGLSIPGQLRKEPHRCVLLLATKTFARH